MMAHSRRTATVLTTTLLMVLMNCGSAGCSKDRDGKTDEVSPTEAPSATQTPEPAPGDESSDDADADSSGGAVDGGHAGAADDAGTDVDVAPDSDEDEAGNDAADADQTDDEGAGGEQAAAEGGPNGSSAAIPAGAGRLKATAIFAGGKRPGRKPVPMGADPFCVNANKGKRVGTENWLVNSKMQVANIVVFVKEGADGEYEPPEAAAKLDQNCCVYLPHVQTLMTNQPLTITNSDATLHNVHSLPNKQRPFNKAQAKKGATDTITFKRPEFIKIKCDVHPWMSAYVAVFDHPFSAVTDRNGAAALDLPPGKYSIGAWHEETGELAAQAVTIEEGKTTDITVNVK